MLDFEFMRENWMFIAGGMGVTLGVSILAFLMAAPMAAAIALGRRSAAPLIHALSLFYTALVDATPLFMQIFFVFLALPQLGIFLPGFLAGVLVLAVNYGARMSEIFYAAFALEGRDWRESMRALAPLFASEFISIIKNSTLISVTGFVHDIMWRATKVGRAEFKNLEALVIAGVIYWMVILSLTYLFKARKFIVTVN